MIRNFVITIQDLPQSVELAERCIASGEKYGLAIEKFDAVTPRNTNVVEEAKTLGIDPSRFEEVYSRTENCIAAFLSHYSLWVKCAAGNDTFTIFEHDAVVINNINPFMAFDKVISLGQPSYGKFVVPDHLGAGPLTSKPYFPGAHAYRLSPQGAKLLVEAAQTVAGPTDIFLHLANFPWLQEHYPWLAIADDSFSTIQNSKGCFAKHNYGDQYVII